MEEQPLEAEVPVRVTIGGVGPAKAVEVPATKPSSYRGLSAKEVRELEECLAKCSSVVKHVKGKSPFGYWSTKKLAKQALQDMEEQKASISATLSSTVDNFDAMAKEVADMRQQVADRDELSERCKKQEATIEALRGKVDSLTKDKEIQAGQSQALLAKVETLTGATPVWRQSGRTGPTSDDKEARISQLTGKVDQLVEEHSALQERHAALTKAKAAADKKAKELQDKLANECELRDREIKKLKAEIARFGETKEEEVKSAKSQGSEQLKHKVAEIKMLRTRVDCAKAEAEAAKQQAKDAKAAVEQAQAAAQRSAEEIKAQKAKVQDMRLQRDELQRDLEMAKGELMAASKEYHTMMKLLPPAALSAHLSKSYNKAAPWPRTAFTARGGSCLHSHACGSIDNTKIIPMEYRDHKLLEEVCVQKGLMLCTRCCQDPGF